VVESALELASTSEVLDQQVSISEDISDVVTDIIDDVSFQTVSKKKREPSERQNIPLQPSHKKTKKQEGKSSSEGESGIRRMLTRSLGLPNWPGGGDV
jgi:hypothetical protein